MGYGRLGPRGEVWTVLEGINVKGSEDGAIAGGGLHCPCREQWGAVCWGTVSLS